MGTVLSEHLERFEHDSSRHVTYDRTEALYKRLFRFLFGLHCRADGCCSIRSGRSTLTLTSDERPTHEAAAELTQ